MEQAEVALNGWIAEAGEAWTGVERYRGENPESGQVEINTQAGVRQAIVIEVQIVTSGQNPVRRDGGGASFVRKAGRCNRERSNVSVTPSAA